MNRLTPREQARHNMVAFTVAMVCIIAAIGYMFVIAEYWPNVSQASIGFRFFVSGPSWGLFALAIAIVFKEIK
jgi:hypothetical protein